MRVAIHQPEFAPWLGYFHKMHSADVYVFLDNVQFKKRYFENRNYLRDSTKDEKVWLTIPVETKGKYNQAIKDVVIKNKQEGESFLLSNHDVEGVIETTSGLQYLVLNKGEDS